MTVQGNAVKTIFNAMAKETFLKVKKWFQEHPDEPYCYWAKDDFIAIKDKDNIDILAAHPEIEDINDHTIVQYDSLCDTVFLSKFCPKLKAGIKAMLDDGVNRDISDGYTWSVFPDDNNFKVLCREKD